MNMLRYSSIYAHFHGARTYGVVDENVVAIPLVDVSWEKSIVLKILKHRRVYENGRPLKEALLRLFRLESVATVFETDDSWAMLIGNRKLVYPGSTGEVFLYATQYFVRKDFRIEDSTSLGDGMFFYRDAIVYLDEHDVPFPGGTYFDDAPTGRCRVCVLTKESFDFNFLSAVAEIEPYATRPAESVRLTGFTDAREQRDLPNVNDFHNTGTISLSKCYDDPTFLLVDVLDSLPPDSRDVGIVLQSPVVVSYTGSVGRGIHFLAFSVDCVMPKRIFRVPVPYDRYYEYASVPGSVRWTKLYYGDGTTAPGLDAVVIDRTIVGYSNGKTFFCLECPKLLHNHRIPDKHEDKIFGLLPKKKVNDDKQFTVIASYKYDATYVLYCVKHKRMPEQMWCLRKEKGLDVGRRPQLSYLVGEWCALAAEYAKSKGFDDLTYVKLMYKLSLHSICYQVAESQKVWCEYKRDRDIVFHVGKETMEFVNRMRMTDEKSDEEVRCAIM